MKPKVVIAGGGAAGMAVALRLERLGVEPLIVEREERLGGKVVKIVFLMELSGLCGREKLAGYDVASVICYEGK